jgi:hypothetical protein
MALRVLTLLACVGRRQLAAEEAKLAGLSAGNPKWVSKSFLKYALHGSTIALCELRSAPQNSVSIRTMSLD